VGARSAGGGPFHGDRTESVDADTDLGRRMAGTRIRGRGGGPFHGDRAGFRDDASITNASHGERGCGRGSRADALAEGAGEITAGEGAPAEGAARLVEGGRRWGLAWHVHGMVISGGGGGGKGKWA
jgi:hypothetical protein